MPKIIDSKSGTVTLGVVDKNLEIQPHLRQVTFEHRHDTPQTVFAHVNGPFTTAEDIVKAAVDGYLHPFESHDEAIAYYKEYGQHGLAATLEHIAHGEGEAARRYEGGE